MYLLIEKHTTTCGVIVPDADPESHEVSTERDTTKLQTVGNSTRQLTWFLQRIKCKGREKSKRGTCPLKKTGVTSSCALYRLSLEPQFKQILSQMRQPETSNDQIFDDIDTLSLNFLGVRVTVELFLSPYLLEMQY